MYSSLARYSSTAFQTASQSNVGGWVDIRNNFMDYNGGGLLQDLVSIIFEKWCRDRVSREAYEVEV